jgi:hypothetical protein
MSPRARSQRKNQPMRPGVPAKDPARLYRLEVAILSGPMAESFAREDPVVSRTIEIRGDQTLARLHATIFAAFDRDDEHLYEFQIGGRRPMDPLATRYGLPEPRGFGFALGAPDPVKSAARAKLEVLGLERPRSSSAASTPRALSTASSASSSAPRRFPKTSGGSSDTS